MIDIRASAALRRAVQLSLLALGSAQAGIALAQTDGGTLADLVVTAQRRAEAIEDVPLSISSQTGESLAQKGIFDLRDLGNVVPGLAFNTQGPFAEPTIRGVQSTIANAGADSPVALYVDGVYQPNQLANVFDLPDISQIEVLRGPQGTLFGRNATGGAITIHTLEPQFEAAGKVGLEYGYYDGSDQGSGEVTARGYFTAPIVADKVAFSIAGYYRNLDGYLTNDNDGSRSGEVKRWLVRGKLLFKPTDNLSVLVTGMISDRDDLQAGATTALRGNGTAGQYPDGVVSTEAWHVASNLYKGSSPVYAHQKALSGKIDWVIPGAGTLSSVTGLTNTSKAEYHVDLDTGTSALCKAAFVCLDFRESYPDKAFQQELNFTSEKFGAFSFVAGAFYYRDNHVFGANIDPLLLPDGRVDPADVSLIGFKTRSVVHTRAKALFGEVTYDFTDRLHAIGGIRYSKEKKWGTGDVVPRFPTTGDREDSAWTPRGSIRFDLTDSTNVYFTYSRGFKSAVLSGFEQSDNIAKPEKLDSFEVGVKSVGDRYRVSAAAYSYDYKNLQAQYWNGTATIYSNAKGAKIRGLEAEGLFQITPEFSVSGGFGWLGRAKYEEFSGVAYQLPNSPGGMVFHVENANGARMLKAPKFTGNLTLAYTTELASGGLDASATLFHSSATSFDLVRRVTQKGYETLNAAVSYSPAAVKGLRVTVFGKNLTNKDYFTSTLLGPSADAPVYSPPRSFGLGAEFSF